MKAETARRLAIAGIVASLVLVAGCYYNHFDLETVDHYSHYGRAHSVDGTYYHGSGED